MIIALFVSEKVLKAAEYGGAEVGFMKWILGKVEMTMGEKVDKVLVASGCRDLWRAAAKAVKCDMVDLPMDATGPMEVVVVVAEHEDTAFAWLRRQAAARKGVPVLMERVRICVHV